MTGLDLFIQRQRIKVAGRYLNAGARVLDLGCADGALFKQIPSVSGIGIDPTLPGPVELPNARLLPGYFPDDIPSERDFDFITMFAVLEHLPPAVQAKLGTDCYQALKPKGKVIITVPSARTDVVLSALQALHLIHGISLEEHYGYDVEQTPRLFSSFEMVTRKSFQLGFNNLFVFAKAG
jgi:SAM-dependent methyltransferase